MHFTIINNFFSFGFRLDKSKFLKILITFKHFEIGVYVYNQSRMLIELFHLFIYIVTLILTNLYV